MFSPLPPNLKACLDVKAVDDCLFSVVEYDLGVPNVQLCADLERVLLEKFACFKNCETFNCETDAEDLFENVGDQFAQISRCGGVDVVATCNSGTFVSDGVESIIPEECLLDTEVDECLIRVYTDTDDSTTACETAVNTGADIYDCLHKCGTFSCEILGDGYYQPIDDLYNTFNCGVESREQCQIAETVAEDNKAVEACLLSIDEVNLGVPNDEVCADLEKVLLEKFACSKKRRTFNCATDAQDVLESSKEKLEQIARCGEVDAVASCNSGTFVSNGVGSTIPQECLLDTEIDECLIRVNNAEIDSTAGECQRLTNHEDDIYECLNKCDTFSCKNLGDGYFQSRNDVSKKIKCDVEFEEQCQIAQAAADDDRAVETCLLSINDEVDLGVPNDEVCADLERVLLEKLACFKKRRTFNCATDAQDIFESSEDKFEQITRCGGVDVLATCNSGTFVSNGVESTIPQECLLNTEIDECLIRVNTAEVESTAGICQTLTNHEDDIYECLNKCDTFSCENLGDSYFQSRNDLSEKFECNVAFGEQCQIAQAVAEDKRAVEACLLTVDEVDLGVSNDEVCANLERALLNTFACFKKRETFNCATDAQDIFENSEHKFEQVTRCGGVDVVASCDSGTFVSNGVESTIPQECLLSTEINECLIRANNAEVEPTAGDCQTLTNHEDDIYECLNKCDTFSCENLGDSYFQSRNELSEKFKCGAEFQEQCQIAQAAAEDDKAVEDCLLSIEKANLGVPNEKVCANLERALLNTFACFKKRETFNCAADAQDIFENSEDKFEQITRCGGVDVVASCNSGTFVSNGVESTIPQECLLDTEVEGCLIRMNYGVVDSTASDCQRLTNHEAETYACLHKCDTFSCGNLGDGYFQSRNDVSEKFKCDVDFEEQCQIAKAVAEDDKALEDCLLSIPQANMRLPNDEVCADLERVLLQKLACFKKHEKFNCATDAKDVYESRVDLFERRTRCGGVDIVETCNSGTFVSNGVESTIPPECLLDTEIDECLIAVNSRKTDFTASDCQRITDPQLEYYSCLKKCDTFSCEDLGDEHFLFENYLSTVAECGIDFRDECENAKATKAAGEGLRAGLTVLLAVGGFALRMIR